MNEFSVHKWVSLSAGEKDKEGEDGKAGIGRREVEILDWVPILRR